MKYTAIGIGIGIGNYVADISVIGISVKTHIGAPLVSMPRPPHYGADYSCHITAVELLKPII